MNKDVSLYTGVLGFSKIPLMYAEISYLEKATAAQLIDVARENGFSMEELVEALREELLSTVRGLEDCI